MNARKSLGLVLLVLVLAALALPGRAAEMVTIPKSRLEELERKEAELEKLKAQLNQTQGEKQQLESEKARLQGAQEQLKKDKAAAEARAAEAKAAEAKTAAAAAVAKAEPVIQHDTPAMTTLPPLQKGEVVDAMDLMNHYRADAPAAEKRYGAGSIRVRGEVTGFDKPMFVSYYVIYLKTTDSHWKVACHVYPPQTYSAAFTVKGGEEMVGTTSAGARTTLAKVGQKVVVEGRCSGLHDQMVRLSGCVLQSAQ